MTFLFKNVKPLTSIIGDSYMKAGEVAFGRDPDTNKVIYKDKDDEVREIQLRLFGRVKGVEEHPFLQPAILGLNFNALRDDMQADLKSMLLNTLQRTDNAKCDVRWVWGNLDATVPYKENVKEVEGWAAANDNFSLQTLDRIGHDMFYENSALVFEEILPFFKG